MKFICVVAWLIIFLTGIGKTGFSQDIQKSAWFKQYLIKFEEAKTPELKNTIALEFYQKSLDQQWIPLTFHDTAIFLYYHSTNDPVTVQVYGDMNRWSGADPVIHFVKWGETKLYVGILKTFPDARLDYKLVINESSWIMDPANKKFSYASFGPNSELTMPKYQYSEWTQKKELAKKGSVTRLQRFKSKELDYEVGYRVYTPPDFSKSKNLPVLYILDGQEYLDASLGAMVTVADNLIAADKIKSVVLVFIDPRNPDNWQESRRVNEFANNEKYEKFITSEFPVFIRKEFGVSNKPEDVGIVGSSLGGVFSLEIGLKYGNIFGNIAAQSPTLWANMDLLDLSRNASNISKNVYIDCGTIHDDLENVRALKSILETKPISFTYGEYNEGLSWGNWKARVDDILLFFWKK